MTKNEYNAALAELEMIQSTMKLHADGIRTQMARAVELTAKLRDVNVRGPRQGKNNALDNNVLDADQAKNDDDKRQAWNVDSLG